MNPKIKLIDHTPTRQEVVDFLCRISTRLGDKFNFSLEGISYSPTELVDEIQNSTRLGETLYSFLESVCEYEKRGLIEYVESPRLPELFSKIPAILKPMIKNGTQ